MRSPSARPDLFRLSQDFAAKLTGLLNRTVCNGAKLTAAVEPSTGVVVVSHKPASDDLARMNCIPVTLSGKAKVFLGLQLRLRLDRSGSHLTVVSSVMLLASDADGTEELLHYDYERDKQDGYPEAHLQVCATSDHWQQLLGSRPLKRLHLPVGGRRYRPTVEDLIEFLVCERLVEPRSGWAEVVAETRTEFQKLQLAAAVRTYPDVARAALRRLDKT